MNTDYQAMQETLMRELRLYHYPVAVYWFFDEKDCNDFKDKVVWAEPVKSMTFCQWEVAARMRGRTVVATPDMLGCGGAQMVFGLKEIDEGDIKTQKIFCQDDDQTSRFLQAKPHLPKNSLFAIAVGPLGSAPRQPDVVHFYCDNMQAYHLSVDYMAATDTPFLRPLLTISSAACGGSVFAWNEKTFNTCPACPGSYSAGKTERGETNVFIPGNDIAAVVKRIDERVAKRGGSSLTKPGDPFPGADICKNCPLIIFKKGVTVTAKDCEGCSAAKN